MSTLVSTRAFPATLASSAPQRNCESLDCNPNSLLEALSAYGTVATVMGRHVVNIPQHAADSHELRRMAAKEKNLSMLNVATTAFFAFGSFSFTPLIPYISRHRWMFFLVASIAMVFVNAPDLYTVVNACSNSERDDKDTHFEPTRPLGRRYARLDSATSLTRMRFLLRCFSWEA
jgi:hypothetical protein